MLGEFEKAAGENNSARVRELLLEAVSGFEPQCEAKDVVMKHQQGKERTELRVVSSEGKIGLSSGDKVASSQDKVASSET